MRTVPILFTFDDKLIMPAGVCITSLLENAKPDTFYDIYILHSDRYDFSSTKLKELPVIYPNCRLTFRAVIGEFIGGYEVRGIPETCYYRLIASDIIPEYDKIIYSDVDVIIREDLSYIYEIDLGQNCFGGVDNCSAIRPEVRLYLDTLGLDWKHGYFYSGNLLINLKVIREENLTKEFRRLGLQNFRQQDMDIMNIACNKRFYRLGPSFCLTNFLYELIVNRYDDMISLYPKEELSHAISSGLIHYNGVKPWQGWCYNFDVWWMYYRKSIFFSENEALNFYKDQIESVEKWSFLKRLKHLVAFFTRRG